MREITTRGKDCWAERVSQGPKPLHILNKWGGAREELTQLHTDEIEISDLEGSRDEADEKDKEILTTREESTVWQRRSSMSIIGVAELKKPAKDQEGVGKEVPGHFPETRRDRILQIKRICGVPWKCDLYILVVEHSLGKLLNFQRKANSVFNIKKAKAIHLQGFWGEGWEWNQVDCKLSPQQSSISQDL